MAAKKKKSRRTAAKRAPRKPRSRAAAGKPHGNEFVPTAEQRRTVQLATAFGLDQEKVARLIVDPKKDASIDKKTLRKHFRDELDRGSELVELELASSLFARAMNPKDVKGPTCAMFLLKCRFKWRQDERVVHEHTAGSGVLLVPAPMQAEGWIARQESLNAGRQSPRLN